MFHPLSVLVLSLAGLWLSIYFCGLYYRWFSPDVPWIPKVCRIGTGDCASVVDTPRAKLFGIPNSVFGLFFFAYLIVDLKFFPPEPALVLSAAALIRSVYLAYSLLFVTRTPCVLCFVSHGINFLLAVLLYADYFFA